MSTHRIRDLSDVRSISPDNHCRRCCVVLLLDASQARTQEALVQVDTMVGRYDGPAQTTLPPWTKCSARDRTVQFDRLWAEAYSSPRPVPCTGIFLSLLSWQQFFAL